MSDCFASTPRLALAASRHDETSLVPEHDPAKTMPRVNSLEGKVIAITGAASGIGRALARAAARQGAKLALADWKDETFDGLRTELMELGLAAENLHLTRLDVSDRSAVFAWAEACVSFFGQVDVLVNNAGVSLYVPIEEMNPDDMKWLFDVNFGGVVHGVQAFLPHLIRSGAGHIVNISSAFGLFAMNGLGAYVASKFAVRGFTEALEIELALAGHPVRVTCVHPGGIRTSLARNGRTGSRGGHNSSHEQAADFFEKKVARYSPEACADAIWAAVRRGSPRLVFGLDARLLDLLARVIPGRYRHMTAWLLRRSGAGAQKSA
jgi:NADP-dependent 3-hydroxy acid dehydrogenase YdfG